MQVNNENFLAILLRLKEQLKMQSDKDVAQALGMTDKAFNARKRRGKFPDSEVLALRKARPDLQLDVDYIFTGVKSAVYDEMVAQAAQRPLTSNVERLVGMYVLLPEEEQRNLIRMAEFLRWKQIEGENNGNV